VLSRVNSARNFDAGAAAADVMRKEWLNAAAAIQPSQKLTRRIEREEGKRTTPREELSKLRGNWDEASSDLLLLPRAPSSPFVPKE
jgi:hypothetical protein